jgi:hypothetical protein
MAQHGMSRTRLYSKWESIKKRTLDPNQENYKYYGGRGIKVCEEWLNNFVAFYDYVKKNLGLPGPKDEIDRIETNGDYEPGNIRWSTRIENMNNIRRNNLHWYKGQYYTMTELFNLLSPVVARDTFRSRISKHGWDVDKAATTPMKDSMQRFKGKEKQVKYKGKLYTLAELAKQAVVNEKTFRKRFNTGWPLSECLNKEADETYATKRKPLPRFYFHPKRVRQRRRDRARLTRDSIHAIKVR